MYGIEEIDRFRKNAISRGEPVLREKSFELLLSIIKDKKPEKILEIGANEGLSGIAMLLSSPFSSLSAIEIDEDKVNIAKKNYTLFGVQDRAKIFMGDAGEILPVLTGKYDFIFLDGPKGHYFSYLPHILSALSVGGILFSDNVLFKGYVFNDNAPQKHNTIKHSMENFLNFISNDKNLKTQILDMEDGVSVTEKLR